MVPDELKRRISSARAKALGEEYEEIPAFSVGDGEPITLPEGVEPKPEVPVTIPQELLEREAASREAILSNLPPAPLRNTVPKKVAPKPKPEPIQAAAPTPPPSAVPAVEPVVAAAPAAGAAAIPEKLLRRSAEARAKASGRSVEEVLAEMTGAQPAASAPVEEAVSEPAPAVEAPAPTAVPTAAAPVAPAPAGGFSVEEVAASLGMPEELLRRSAEAKAKALGVPLEQVLADTYGLSAGGAPPATEQAPVAAAPQPAAPVVETPAAPVAAAPAGSVVSLEEAAAKLGMPEKLLRRSAEAKAKALGVPLEEVLADMLGVSAPAAEQAPVAAAPQPAAPVVETPAAPVAAAPAGSVVSLEEAAAKLGMPEKLLRRSAEAKAKALGVPLEEVLADMLGVSAPAAEQAPVAAAPQPAAPVVETPAAPVAPSEVPVTVEPAGVVAEPQAASLPAAAGSDEVDPWPALFRIELFTAIISAVFLALLALAGPAPLFEPASGVVDPSKAPWYLLWMQQLLAWLQPQVAAFFIPLVIIVGLFAVPFIDRSTDREGRRVGLLVFGFFVLALVVLTILGFISRASGFGYPWLGA